MSISPGQARWTLVIASLMVGATLRAQPRWAEWGPGLEVAEVAGAGDGAWSLVAVRVDPARFEVVVLSAGAGGQALTADAWAHEHGLTVVANAGMYRKDGRTPVGYLRSDGREVGGHWARKWGAALVAGPPEGRHPPATILDASCDGPLREAARGWRHVVQGLRMLTCQGENTFRPGGRRAARLAAGVDGAGRLLFVFHRTPVTEHDFVAHVQEAGLDAHRLMYLEGGSEASLYLRGPSREIRFGGIGSTELGQWTRLPEGVFLPIPNVIGLRGRDHDPDSGVPASPPPKR